jgi:hypothetical protein
MGFIALQLNTHSVDILPTGLGFKEKSSLANLGEAMGVMRGELLFEEALLLLEGEALFNLPVTV